MIEIEMEKSKKKISAGNFKPYRENLSIIKLLCLPEKNGQSSPFADFQKKYDFPIGIIQVDEKFLEWSSINRKIIFRGKMIEDLGIFNEEEFPAFLKMLSSAENDFSEILQQEVNLPEHFHSYLFDYLVFGIENAPAVNFSFSLYKTDKSSSPDELLNGGSKYIGVNVYAPLSPCEKTLIFEFLEKLTEMALPSEVAQKRKLHTSKKDLDVIVRAFMAEQPKNVGLYENLSYSDYLNQSHKRGGISKRILEKVEKGKKRNPIEDKAECITSIEIAEAVSSDGLKITSDNLRKIKSRVHKKRARLFKNM